MREKLSFKADLWDGFAVVVKSEANGVNLFKDIYNYFRKRAQIEEEYAKNLQKLQHKTFERKETIGEGLNLREREREKEKEEVVEASGQSLGDAWTSVERAAQVEAQAHATFSAAILELIVEPCKTLIRDCEERLKVLQAEGQRITNEQQQYMKNLEKGRGNHQKLTKDAEAAKSAFDEAAKDPKSKEVSKLEKKHQKAVQEAEAAVSENRSLETEANNFLRNFHSELMPRVMEDLEKLDTMRLTAMSTQVQKFTSLLEEVPKRVSFTIQPVLSAVSAVNVEQDIQKFIKKHTTNSKPPASFLHIEPQVHTDMGSSGEYPPMSAGSGSAKSKRSAKSLVGKLSTNFKTIRSGNAHISTSPKTVSSSALLGSPSSSPSTSFHKGSIFGMRLDEMMRRQVAMASSLEVPLPLVVLAHAILHQNGASTEGVFRIPAPSSELQRLIKQFDEGNFIIDFAPTNGTLPPSVHCLAGALKKLLRESPDSLIPASQYDKAIAQETLAEHGNAPQNLVAALPDVNRRVTMFVVRFLQEFLHPDCVARSKMTLDNIAMVFAPTVLRSPSEDLNVMVANSLREKAFVRLLLETQPSFAWWALPGENPPPTLSSDLPNSPRLTLEVLQAMLDTVQFSATSGTPTASPARSTTPTPFTPPSLSLSSSPALSPLPAEVSALSETALRRRSHSLDFADSAPIPIPTTSRDRSCEEEAAPLASTAKEEPPAAQIASTVESDSKATPLANTVTVADNYDEEYQSTPPSAPSLSPYRVSRPPPPPRPRRNFPPSAASTPPSLRESAGDSTESTSETEAYATEEVTTTTDTNTNILEEEITRLKAVVAHEMSTRVLAEEAAKRSEAETQRITQERDILERAQATQREQIERLRDQLDAARADAFSTQAQAESARELSEQIRAHEANALRELEAARAEAARAREEVQRALEEKNREVEEKRREVEEKAKEVSAKTREVEEKARLVQEKTKEAEAARREAELARGEGERAKVAAETEAERVRKEMEKAKGDAEAAREQLLRARMEAEEAMRRQVDVAVAGTDEGELQADENDEKVLERVRSGPIVSIAEQRDEIAGELVFLATRLAYATDIGVLMDLSKALRSIRHALDAVIQATGMEDWQIAQLCRIYASSLPSLLTPLEELPAGDPPGPLDQYADVEKVRKMRTIALHAARACIDLVSALVAHSILSGRMSSVTKQIQNQFSVITSKLLSPEQKLTYVRREARGLVAASEQLVLQVKNAFPHTPADRLADLARPIIALVKDLDTFFSWAGLDVPIMGSPLPDDRVTDDRLRRVRAMLFMSLNKVGAQAVIMRNSLEAFGPTDPRVMPTIERVHLIVEALQVSATPI